MTHRETVTGVLLAGGMSRRMGGVEKALMRLGEKTLIARAAGRLTPQVSQLVVNANGDPSRFTGLALDLVPDQTEERQGPLAGILTALDWFAARAPDMALMASLPADTPFVPDNLVARLREALARTPGARVAVAQSRGRRHPATALWTRETAADIRTGLERGDRKAEAMIDRLGAVAVPFDDFEIDGRTVDPFFNINTPDDLDVARSIAAALDGQRAGS